MKEVDNMGCTCYSSGYDPDCPKHGGGMKVYCSPEFVATLKQQMQMSPSTWHKVMNPNCGICLAERGMRMMLNKDCHDCAVRWSCSLEADGPEFEPCPKHRRKDVCPDCGHAFSRHLPRWGGICCMVRSVDASGNFDGCGCSTPPSRPSTHPYTQTDTTSNPRS